MKRSLLLFCAGGLAYPALELAWRGRTHPSMSLAGGLCLCLIDKACGGNRHGWFRQCAAGSCIITGVEFAFGICVNLIGKREVWDYSKVPGNLLGQVCLPFSIGWFFLSIPAIHLCNLCRRLPFLQK